jgi:hypothetical protein
MREDGWLHKFAYSMRGKGGSGGCDEESSNQTKLAKEGRGCELR